ncbi:MAG: 50S ribosomal protein L13 [Chthonomonadales bacterium]|nr:50S ribosomal protein L13 [Chthonomonadales bacterium]
MRTFSAKPEEVTRDWHVIDAAGYSMGRLASDVARLLRGKHKPIYTPHIDTGDFVIVVNAAKLVLTGRKAGESIYRHSGWPGGLKSITRGAELERRPREAFRRVVRGMLPHNRLGDAMINKLKVYAGPDHPHAAQKPTEWVSPAGKQGE